jgi:uncharacterized small protein (TIGR04563 family)
VRLSDPRKISIFFPEGMEQEIRAEAVRTDRSISWLMQRAWELARADLARLPNPADMELR